MLNFLLAIADTSIVPDYEVIDSVQGIANNQTPSLVALSLRSIAALCLVIGVMFVFAWILRKLKKGSLPIKNNDFIKVLGRSYLNSKQSIYLVEVQNRILVLGVSGDSINVLSEILDSNTVNSIRQSANNKPFASHLQSKLSRFISKSKHSPVRVSRQFNGLEGSGLWD